MRANATGMPSRTPPKYPLDILREHLLLHLIRHIQLQHPTRIHVEPRPGQVRPENHPIRPEQVDNVALAVAERRELDAEEKAELDRATERAFANLPYHYRWLKDWEYV